MKINPIITQFVIFSGGGGLVSRSQSINLIAGKNIFEVQDVPSSFIGETVKVELENVEAKLTQIVIKKPDQAFVDSAMNRERQASERILKEATDVRTELREELLGICEGLRSYIYEDSNSELTLTFDSKTETIGKIKITYMIDDPRIYWTPSLQVNMSMNEEEASLTGYILVENGLNINFDDVDLKFVEFGNKKKVKKQSQIRNDQPNPPPGMPPMPSSDRTASVGQLRGEMLKELRRLRDVFVDE